MTKSAAIWSRRIWDLYKIPVGVLVVGSVVSATIGVVLKSLGTFMTIDATFLGGSLAIFGSIWQSQWSQRKSDLAILDTLRRTIQRQLQVPYFPKFLETIKSSETLPLVQLHTPIELPHLSEAVSIAAQTIEYDTLYTDLIEVTKLVNHINFIHSLTPLLSVSEWGLAGLDVVNAEFSQIAFQDPKQSLPLLRQYKLWVQREVDEAKHYLLLDEYLKHAECDLTRILDNREVSPTPSGPLVIEKFENPYRSLLTCFTDSLSGSVLNLKVQAGNLLAEHANQIGKE